MRHSKGCNCQHLFKKEALKLRVNHYFCYKCGNLLLKDSEGNIHHTLKSKQNKVHYDLSPITIIKNMKKKTDENTPFIYENYNINRADKYILEKSLKSIDIYLRHRKFLLLTLQKMVKIFDYCDIVFYQCLFYLDTYLSHNISEDISEKKLLYYLIGFFLCSVKFKETDTFEPPLDSFYGLSKGIYLHLDKIKYYEIICLKMINYNAFNYSTYDWITHLITNGIVFNCEINKDNEIIVINGHRHSLVNHINRYAIKLLLNLTSNNIFFKYAPMYLAFCLIQLAREKFLDKNLINHKLFFDLVNLYGITPGDYIKCYEEIKSEINLEKEKHPKEKEGRNHNIKDEIATIERAEKNRNDNNMPNKLRSSASLFQVKDNILIVNERDINENEKEQNQKEIIFPEIISNNLNSKRNNSLNHKKSILNSNKKSRQHFSIDCNINLFKSNENIGTINPYVKEINPFLTINKEKSIEKHTKNLSLSKKKDRPEIKDLKHMRHYFKRFNSLEANKIHTNANEDVSTPIQKEKEKPKAKKKSKFFSNKNLEYNYQNDDGFHKLEDELIKKNHLTSKKLPKIIGIGESNMNRISTNNIQSNMINNINKNKGQNILKNAIDSLELNISLEEDGFKINKSSNKRIQVN